MTNGECDANSFFIQIFRIFHVFLVWTSEHVEYVQCATFYLSYFEFSVHQQWEECAVKSYVCCLLFDSLKANPSERQNFFRLLAVQS